MDAVWKTRLALCSLVTLLRRRQKVDISARVAWPFCIPLHPPPDLILMMPGRRNN